MKIPYFYFLLLIILATSCSIEQGEKTELIAGDLGIVMNDEGQIKRLYDLNTGIDYLHPDSVSYLVQLRIDSNIIHPVGMEIKEAENMLYFYFQNDMEVKISMKAHGNYLGLEFFNIRGSDTPDLLIWGPIYTSIDKTIGETVGVVRNKDFAIGIQSLNPKTLGGYPWLENDVMPEMDYFDQEDYSDLKKGGIAHTLYRIEAARPVKGGSAMHAYCRRRYDNKRVENWGYDNYLVKAFDDNGIIGSAIALFGTHPDKVMQTIAIIEKTEGLRSKLAPEAASAYMILGFGENDIELALDYCKRAGLKYLYHGDPFESWGHFKLKKSFFPKGRASLKSCVDKASTEGIAIGLHTLSNFITTNDAYVTPIPDRRLAVTGYSVMPEGIGASKKEILIEDPSSFNQFRNNYLKAVRIGEEIIRYAAVSETEPWRLLDCQRGSFGTLPARHSKQDTIFKLADHAYKVFLSNPALTLEIAENIADLYNETGVRQISFDGLEGCRSTGMGNYGEILFTKTWYDHLDPGIREHYIADASRSSHYFWHIFTRMNWGEPWYAGFRESQTEYRLKNQQYFDRNYIPNMLGWFLMKPETSMEDIHWLLARSAAYDAGYAFVTSYDALAKNGNTDQILAAISLWEEARMKGIFNNEQKLLMKDVDKEFVLSKNEEGIYTLQHILVSRITHTYREKQPGEPLMSTGAFNNEGNEQELHFIITAKKGTVINPDIEIGGNRLITIPVKLNEGEHLKYEGEFANVYDPHWQLLKSISLDKSQLIIKQGGHNLAVSCEFMGNEGEMLVELRMAGETIPR